MPICQQNLRPQPLQPTGQPLDLHPLMTHSASDHPPQPGLQPVNPLPAVLDLTPHQHIQPVMKVIHLLMQLLR